MTESAAGSTAGRVLVTGATGFVGRQLLRSLCQRAVPVVAALRHSIEKYPDEWPVLVRRIADIGPDTDWQAALSGVDRVVHLAAHVHVMRGASAADYWRVNAEGTRQLARQAAASGVRRFIVMSSIKVNGEFTTGRPFRADDVPGPVDDYALSKLAAERALWDACSDGGMQGVVVRPPLVYGPGSKANFARLLRAVGSGIPLPLPSVKNRRAMISVWNLVALVELLLDHPAAVGRTWLASDGEALSTTELVQRMAGSMQRPARLISVPPSLLAILGAMTGQLESMRRLTQSLEVDSSPAAIELGFSPVLSLDESLRLTVTADGHGRERSRA